MQEIPEVETSRYKALPKPFKIIFLILSGLGIGAAVYFNFNWTFLGGYTFPSLGYYWFFLAMFVPSGFLILPARKKDRTALR